MIVTYSPMEPTSWKIFHMWTPSERHNYLLQYMQRHLQSCDFLLCLFFSALNSSQADQCLRPFPPGYIENGVKDFQKLKKLCERIPPLKELLEEGCCDEMVDLLLWVFIESGMPTLTPVKQVELPYLATVESSLVPTYILSVINPRKLDTWGKKCENRRVFVAFHGSRVENFYSILKVGLQQHLSSRKVLLYGEGIYLSSEISVSMNYASFGQTWNKSLFGNKHSVIAVCEVIDDFDKVKCRDLRYKERSLVSDAVEEVPEKYFIVTDSELVRIKYLMVYKAATSPIWVATNCNKLVAFLIGYFMVLVFVGFANSSFGKNFWQMCVSMFFD